MSTNACCQLCLESKPLRQSHIVPKFVFDAIKRRGIAIRGYDNPNLPLQDGPKPRLLCHDCEERFSEWERHAAIIFRNLHSSDDVAFRYGPAFLPFAVSLSFRVLSFFADWVRALPEQINTVLEHRSTALTSWRPYLLGKQTTLGPFEHHCIILSPVNASTPEAKMLDSFIDGIIDFQPPFIAPDHSTVVVAKLCRLCIIGTLKRGRNLQWVNTRIAAKGGTFAPPFAVPTWFVHYLKDRFATARAGARGLSARQRELLWDRARREGWLPAT